MGEGMNAEKDFDPRLLDVLLHHDLVLAALWLTKGGKVRARRGQAMALKIGADDPTTVVDLQGEGAGEAVYIRGIGKEEYLMVLFDDRADFDQLKRDVDETIRLRQAEP